MLLVTTAGAGYKAAPDLASIPNTALTPCLSHLLGEGNMLTWHWLLGTSFTGVVPYLAHAYLAFVTMFYRGGTTKQSALPKFIHYKSVEPGCKH